jgi:excisionase family DNA binding protein
VQVVDEAYYTLAEIAQRLKVSYRTVYRWVQAKELPAYKLGTEWRVAESDLQAFLQARKIRRRHEER